MTKPSLSAFLYIQMVIKKTLLIHLTNTNNKIYRFSQDDCTMRDYYNFSVCVCVCVCLHTLWFTQSCKNSTGVFSACGTEGLRTLEKSAEECRLHPNLDIFSKGVEEKNVVKLRLAALPFEEVPSRLGSSCLVLLVSH